MLIYAFKVIKSIFSGIRQKTNFGPISDYHRKKLRITLNGPLSPQTRCNGSHPLENCFERLEQTILGCS